MFYFHAFGWLVLVKSFFFVKHTYGVHFSVRCLQTDMSVFF